MRNRINDYRLISDLLKEDMIKEISDQELEKRLENVSKLALYKVMYFEHLDRKWYEKQFDNLRKWK